MKKLFGSTIAVSLLLAQTPALAGAGDDLAVRLATIERENAAMKKEIAAFRENKKLREKKSAFQRDAARFEPPVNNSSPTIPSGKAFDAYAADLPAAYKARPAEASGQFTVWGDGAAIFTGGTPTDGSYTLLDFNTFVFPAPPIASQGPAGNVDLRPKIGWEAATGFDYRFSDQLWHVSGAFRYGQSRASGGAATAGGVDPALFAAAGFPLPAGFTTSGTDSIALRNTETHWQADLAVGRDVLGSGRDAMQLKFGLRIAEFEQNRSALARTSLVETFGAPINIGGVPLTGLALDSVTNTTIRNSFLGAGPRFGIEGAVPLAENWSFDYQGDVAALFGQQRIVSSSTVAVTTVPANLIALLGGTLTPTTSSSDQRFATVFNADMQVGVSYWLTRQVKVSASYRLDAYFNVIATTLGTNAQTIDRYIHGPRLGVSATF